MRNRLCNVGNWGSWTRILAEFLRCRRGVVTMEYALTFPVLLMLVVMTIELAIMTLADLSLQQGMEAAARSIRTGDIRSSTDVAAFKTKVCANVLALVDCSDMLLNVQTFGSVGGSNPYGGFGTVTYPMPIYDQDGNVTNYSFGVGGTKLQITSVQVKAIYHFLTPGVGLLVGGVPTMTTLSHAMILVTEPF